MAARRIWRGDRFLAPPPEPNRVCDSVKRKHRGEILAGRVAAIDGIDNALMYAARFAISLPTRLRALTG
jgi:hypothetical protein